MTVHPTGGPSPSHPSDLTARFSALVAPDADPVALDELCTVVAAHFSVGADPDGTDTRAVRTGLDDLAKGVTRPDLTGVLTHLRDLGVGGDARDYASAASSLLPDVVRRRRGLPIMLAVVAVEVGRRVGVDAHVVGTPGHVLVGDPHDPHRFADPFHGEVQVSVDGARALFGRIHGREAPWDPGHLRPLPPRDVVVRILANLANRYRSDARHRDEAVALGLRSLVPGASLAERGALAAALARSGAFDRAAEELEALADAGGAGIEPDALRAKAERWRATLN